MASSLPSLAVLTALLAAAVGWDVLRRRVPNPLSLAVAATGLAAQLYTAGFSGVASGAAALLATGALLWFPWSKGHLGGGDLKLAAATATWLGLARLPGYLLSAAIAGGLLSVVCYAFSTRDARTNVRANLVAVRLDGRLPPMAEAEPGRVSVPYAAAIASGALVGLALEVW